MKKHKYAQHSCSIVGCDAMFYECFISLKCCAVVIDKGLLGQAVQGPPLKRPFPMNGPKLLVDDLKNSCLI